MCKNEYSREVGSNCQRNMSELGNQVLLFRVHVDSRDSIALALRPIDFLLLTLLEGIGSMLLKPLGVHGLHGAVVPVALTVAAAFLRVDIAGLGVREDDAIPFGKNMQDAGKLFTEACGQNVEVLVKELCIINIGAVPAGKQANIGGLAPNCLIGFILARFRFHVKPTSPKQPLRRWLRALCVRSGGYAPCCLFLQVRHLGRSACMSRRSHRG